MTVKIDFFPPDKMNSQRFAWSTDLHLSAVEPGLFQEWLASVVAMEPHGLILTGDITNGHAFCSDLLTMVTEIQKPIYFVLGNHDYYNHSISSTKQVATEFAQGHDLLNYMTACEILPLNPDVALIGHDGWADGRCGDFLSSSVRLNDYVYISELKNIDPEERLKRLNRLGTEAAQIIGRRLKQALDQYPHVVIMTHVPPIAEASCYGGHPADDNWGPHFVCQALGDTIREIAPSYPKNNILVLCGHAHHGADVQMMENVRVVTGASKTGAPHIQGLIQL